MGAPEGQARLSTPLAQLLLGQLPQRPSRMQSWKGPLLSIPQVTLHLLGDTGWHTNVQSLNELILLWCEKHLKEEGCKGGS